MIIRFYVLNKIHTLIKRNTDIEIHLVKSTQIDLEIIFLILPIKLYQPTKKHLNFDSTLFNQINFNLQQFDSLSR